MGSFPWSLFRLEDVGAGSLQSSGSGVDANLKSSLKNWL